MPELHAATITRRVLRGRNRRLHRTSRLIAVQSSADIREAINLMQVYDISQLPVLDGERIVGSLDERALMERLMEADHCLWGAVTAFMQPPLPALEDTATVEKALDLLRHGAPGVIVTIAGTPVGIITPADFIAFKVYGGSLDYQI
jgi:predicted transcriptional regulator